MSGAFLASKTVVREEEPALRSLQAAASSIAGFAGVAERGPFGESVLVTSFEQYLARFGGYLAENGALIHAVAGFFENGGTHLYVARVAHHTDPTDPATLTAVRSSADLTTPGADAPGEVFGGVGPFNLEPGQTIVVSVSGGGDLTATFSAANGYVETGAGPFVLANGQTLTFAFQGGDTQTVTIDEDNFADVGAATSSELANEINRQIFGGRAIVVAGKCRIQSDRRGTSSSVSAPAGTAAAACSFAAAVAGTGNVANIDAVTHAEAETVIEAAVAGIAVVLNDDGETGLRTSASGAGVSVRVKNTSTATAFGFDNATHSGADDASENVYLVESYDPGTALDGATVQIKAATSGEDGLFDLVVAKSGVVLVNVTNASPDPASAAYIGTKLASDRLVRITDLGLDGNPRPSNQTATFAGGDAGLVGLADSDFVGGATDGGRVGLRVFDTVLDLGILAVPSRSSTSTVANAMITYCETTRGGTVFAVLDPPAGASATGIVTYVESTASLLETTEHAAIYWPRVKVPNPKPSIFGATVTSLVVAPSGHVAGVYARVDGKRPGGVYDSPAGYDAGRAVLRGVLGLETDEALEVSKRDLVYPKRINPITTAPGRPIYIDGGRTLRASGNFPNVSERRGVIVIEKTLVEGLDFCRHSPNDEVLQGRVRRTVVSFLTEQMTRGAFRSRDPETAFYVVCDETNNTPAVVFAGILQCRIGLATQKPAEFVEFVVSQDTRAFEA